jgi:glycosyltransferase involved in cell wall biosynthesis
LHKSLKILKIFVRFELFRDFILGLILSRSIRSVIRSENLNIIYACEPLSIIAARFLAPKRTYITKVRRIAVIHSSWHFRSILRKILAKALLGNFDKIIVSTIDTTSYARIKEIQPKKCIFVPNWVDTDRFRPIFKEKKNLRKILKIGINDNDIVILYNARLTFIKNPINVLLAFIYLKKKIGENLKMIILGTGILEKLISNIIYKFKLERDIILLKPFPYESEYYPLIYNISDIFVLVPYHTGFSITALEALASGLTVIYSNNLGIPPDIKKVLIQCNPRSVKDIIYKLTLAYNYVVKGCNNVNKYQKIVNRYDKKTVLNRLISIIEDINR